MNRPRPDQTPARRDETPRVLWSFDRGGLEGPAAVVETVGAETLSAPVEARAPWAMPVGSPVAVSAALGIRAPRTMGCVLRPVVEVDRREAGAAPRAPVSRPRSGARRATRVRPPNDVVRFQDRLAYLLQPPLEALVDARSLRFPFVPFDYQMDGVAFLFPRRHAVIADEMGLGKTMQAITAIRLLAHSGQLRRVLVVCPKPLISNWRRELEAWAPELSIVVAEGSPARRAWLWSEASVAVTIAGYETVVRDRKRLHQEDQRFDLVVLDESQRIKNPGAATHQAVSGLRRERSWALTGTPIENSLDDLVGIFGFVAPGTLRTGMRPREIGAAVRDAVLRRTKENVLTDLPPKTIRDTTVDLAPAQWESYQRAEGEGVVRLEGMDRELTIHHVFELVLRLKQICNFDPATGESSKAERLEADLEECVASGRKAIVFSQWVDTVERLAERLARFGPERFHGGVPHGRRDAVLQRFRDDPDRRVLLMSYGAGSVGLNLQFASYVFLFDRWWNPAVEDQAINRAHRIGAAGPVTVSRYLCAGTIEQRIDEVLCAKRRLFEEVFRDDGPRSSGLTRDELFSLFRLRTDEGPLDASSAA